MTPEQDKALKIVQEIEAKAREMFDARMLGPDTWELKGKARAAAEAKAEQLEEFEEYLKQLAAKIESDFGVAYECVDVQSFEKDSVIPNIKMAHQCKTMVRCDGKVRYDYKIQTCGILAFKND